MRVAEGWTDRKSVSQSASLVRYNNNCIMMTVPLGHVSHFHISHPSSITPPPNPLVHPPPLLNTVHHKVQPPAAIITSATRDVFAPITRLAIIGCGTARHPLLLFLLWLLLESLPLMLEDSTTSIWRT